LFGLINDKRKLDRLGAAYIDRTLSSSIFLSLNEISGAILYYSCALDLAMGY
jgi:hypothetical protein